MKAENAGTSGGAMPQSDSRNSFKSPPIFLPEPEFKA
jgi:hypothetical protein